MSDCIKVCGCGCEYHDADAWRRLDLCGIQDLGQGESAELRHCSCGSTIAVLVAALEEDDRLTFELSRRASIAGWYATAKIALALARRYVTEGGGVDHRVIACVRAVSQHRQNIVALRTRRSSDVDEIYMIGLRAAA